MQFFNFFPRVFIFYFPIVVLAVAPNLTSIIAYNDKLEEVLNAPSKSILESLKQFSSIFTVFGGEISVAIVAGIGIEYKDISPDWIEVSKLALNHSLDKLSTLENKVNHIYNDPRLKEIEISMEKYSIQASILSSTFKRLEKYKNGALRLRKPCEDYDPQLRLDIFTFNTRCSPLREKDIQNYAMGLSHMQRIEAEIDFTLMSTLEKMKYNTIKLQYVLLPLLESMNVDEILRNLKATAKMPVYANLRNANLDLHFQADFSPKYGIAHVIDKLQTLSLPISSCWLKVAFAALKGNRKGMQLFIRAIEYEVIRGGEQALICASVDFGGDEPAMLAEYLTQTQELIQNITMNIQNFLTNFEPQIFPTFITSRIKSVIGFKPIEPSNFNITAKIIGDEIAGIDNSEKYNYHVILTDLTIDNYGSKFQCKSDAECLDITFNNIRVFVVRYDIVDLNMTSHILDGTTLLKGNLPKWQKSIKHSAIQAKLDYYANKFFPLTANAFTTVILHNEQQNIFGDTVINFGCNNVNYQGAKTSYSIDHFVDYQWPANDHLIKIIFFLH